MMSAKEIRLDLKKFSCFEVNNLGVFVFTEHDFKVFIPNGILERINDTKKMLKRNKK